MEIIRAGMQEAGRAAALAQLLWPGHAQAELEQELAGYLQGPEGAVFLAREDGADVGFAQCGLRRDYVEGSSTSPVGYLEDIFVLPEHRRCGIARRLVEACQSWAQLQGCKEFASDCELDNLESQRFHQACGFAEVNRIVCFLKKG